MRRNRISMGFLALGTLALTACGTSGEKVGSGVSGGEKPRAAASGPATAAEPEAKPETAAKPVAAPKKEAAVAETGGRDKTTISCLSLVESSRFEEALPVCERALKAHPASVEVQTAVQTAKTSLAESEAAQAAEKAKGAMVVTAGMLGGRTGGQPAGQPAKEQVVTAPGQAPSAAASERAAAQLQPAAPAKPGETVVRFDNDKLKEHGPVEFSHPKHKEAFGQEKLDCKPCHLQPPPLFQMKKRAVGETRYTMDDMKQGKACGKCHDGKTLTNGKVVFGVTSEDDCGKCHER